MSLRHRYDVAKSLDQLLWSPLKPPQDDMAMSYDVVSHRTRCAQTPCNVVSDVVRCRFTSYPMWVVMPAMSYTMSYDMVSHRRRHGNSLLNIAYDVVRHRRRCRQVARPVSPEPPAMSHPMSYDVVSHRTRCGQPCLQCRIRCRTMSFHIAPDVGSHACNVVYDVVRRGFTS